MKSLKSRKKSVPSKISQKTPSSSKKVKCKSSASKSSRRLCKSSNPSATAPSTSGGGNDNRGCFKKNCLFTSLLVTIVVLVAGIALFFVLTRGNSGKDNGGSESRNYKGVEWIYDDQSGWPSTCLGKSKQSPINIDTSAVTKDSSLTLYLLGFHQHSNGWTVENDGHSVKFTFTGDSHQLALTGSVVGDRIFRLAQFHFHWGDGHTSGSEHRIDNTPYPMETHFVHYNSKYPGFSEALGQTDGIVVLAVLNRLGSNSQIADIVKIVSELGTSKGEAKSLNYHIRLKDLMVDDVTKFYTYSGSLTTPPCTEDVTWIVLKDHASIDDQQLKAWRRLQKYNFRDVQDRGERVVKTSF